MIMGSRISIADNINTSVIEATTTAILNNTQQCSSSVGGNQVIQLQNIKAGNGCKLDISTNQIQTQNISFNCLNSAEQQLEVLNNIRTLLNNDIDTKIQGVAGSIAESNLLTNKTEYINRIMSQININSLVSCVSSALNNQTTMIDTIEASCPLVCSQKYNPEYGSINDYNNLLNKNCTVNISSFQDLTQTVITKCINENKQMSNVIENIATDISTSTTLTSEGIDFTTILVVIGIVMGVLVLLFLLYKLKNNESNIKIV